MSRKIIPFVVAFVLVCLVMVVSGVFAFSGAVTAEKFGADVAWSQSYNAPESMKVIDVTGDGKDDLFLQTTDNISVWDENGASLFSFGYATPKSTLGDVDGDGMEDIVVYYVGQGMSVDVISKGQQKTLATALDIGFPARVAIIRFASGPQIILGDNTGNLLSISLDGKPLWSSALGSEEVRGLDDAKISGTTYLAAASHSGVVAVIDSEGKTSGNLLRNNSAECAPLTSTVMAIAKLSLAVNMAP